MVARRNTMVLMMLPKSFFIFFPHIDSPIRYSWGNKVKEDFFAASIVGEAYEDMYG